MSGLKTSPEKQDGVEQNKPIDKEKVVVAPKKLHITKSEKRQDAIALCIKYSIENEMNKIFAVLLGIGLIATYYLITSEYHNH